MTCGLAADVLHTRPPRRQDQSVKPAPFVHHAPRTVEEAVTVLGQVGHEGKVLAGGQSLIPILNMRLASPAHLVDINAVVGLDEGGAYLQFWGASEDCSLVARMEGDQADVSFYDDGQVQRATLGLDSDGPALQMRDSEGRCRVQLDVDEDGPSLVVYDEQQQEQAAVRCPD